MSHPAVVAYENDDGTFDLHYSRNGAEEYQLKEVLEGYLEGKYEKMGSEMPPLLPTEVAEIARQKEEVDVVEFDLIEETPFIEQVESKALQYTMPGMGVELLYVVHDWKVDVYSIIPITPSLLPTLAAAVKIRLYHAAQENIFSNETGGFESTTKYELSGTDYFDLSVYQTMPNDIYYTFAQFHLDLLDYVNVVESDEQSSDPDSPPPRLYHDGCVLEYDICESIAPIKFSSIFVEVWSGDETDPAYHWGHHPDNPSPRRIANQLRLELSMDLVSRVRESISQLSLESWTPHFAFYPHRERELNRFFTYLETRYADRISGEFSEFSF